MSWFSRIIKREVDIKGLLSQQKSLQADFESAQATFYKARSEHDERKILLTEFNDQYGRVLQLLAEDS